MAQLYEDYLSSGENWLQSSLVVNANRQLSSKRRGKYKMCTYKDLKALYGPGVARQLRDSKKDQELAKDANDGTIYWCEHPDFKGMNKEDWGEDIGKLFACVCFSMVSVLWQNRWFVMQEMELIRIWDSLTFEDECEDILSIGLQASGTLDESQTKAALQLVMQYSWEGLYIFIFF